MQRYDSQHAGELYTELLYPVVKLVCLLMPGLRAGRSLPRSARGRGHARAPAQGPETPEPCSVWPPCLGQPHTRGHTACPRHA